MTAVRGSGPVSAAVPCRWPGRSGSSDRAPATERLVVLANRLPVEHNDDGSLSVAPGGLVTALAPVMERRGGTWIGWDGQSTGSSDQITHRGFSLVPIGVSQAEHEGYYVGLSNSGLWPVYHGMTRPVPFDPDWWPRFEAVNRRFARAAADAASPGGTVWIHDYHLQLVPPMLRRLRPDVRIGFFLHTPFPSPELLGRLPWRNEIIDGLLGADLIGLQTEADVSHFRSVLEDLGNAGPVQARPGALAVDHDGRQVQVRALPISIDPGLMAQLASSPSVMRRADELRQLLGYPRRVLLGVDRLDYTKGIDVRLEAYRGLLDSGSLDPDEVTFVQIAAPSRADVPGYGELRERVDGLVGDINGSHGRPGRYPVHYYRRNHSLEEICAFYRLADVMVVTPFRDGMNLVAKEFVASRTDGRGALVLSEFAGSAAELDGAVLCNPFDQGSLQAAIMEAYTLTPAEQFQRMEPMQHQIRAHTVGRWAATFLGLLEGSVVDPDRIGHN